MMYEHITNSSKTIDDYQYNRLPYAEKRQWRRKYEEEDVKDSIIDTAIDVGIGLAVSSLFNDSPSINDSPSFGGFDGGDFGGGGASGDF